MESDSAAIVHARDLTKVYRVPVRESGLGAAFRSLFRRKTRDILAVNRISFDIREGEIVGFLGPNGAGKTTTLKMLAGLLYPTSGTLKVLGYQPWKREKHFLRQITLVIGNRSQLVWDIPAADSFELQRAIYNIPKKQFRETVAELTDVLDLAPLLRKPLRNLSLGERMKCEIAGALLHRPRLLFLDEPTLGLDVTMQRRIREFIKYYNQRYHATILLSSHYMADVEALCDRILVIHHGQLLFDGELDELIERFSTHKTIEVQMRAPEGDLSRYGEVIERSDGYVSLRVPRKETAKVTERLLAELPIIDLTVEDPPVEEVVERIFAQGHARSGKQNPSRETS